MKLPEWVGPGTRVVKTELPDGYVPPSASMNPAATVEGGNVSGKTKREDQAGEALP